MARVVAPATAAAHEVLRAVRETLGQTPEGLVLVACSGGPDSLALAAATAQVCAVSGRRAGALVVDHQLQQGSDQVAQVAVQGCRSLGLTPVEVLAVTVSAGVGPEAAARQARYQAMDELAADLGAVAVLLGHSLDDQAETVLLGLARGSGTRSLAGMAPTRGRYLRPLLGLKRPTMRAACKHWDLVPWDDPHNEDPAYTRVRVRGVVLPVLEAELGPGIVGALARTADLARADADALDEWAKQYWQALPAAAEGSLGLDASDLAELPLAIRTRVIRLWLAAQDVPLQRLAAEHIWQVERMVSHWRGQGPISLPGRIAVRREYGRLVVVPDDPRTWSRGVSNSSSEES